MTSQQKKADLLWSLGVQQQSMRGCGHFVGVRNGNDGGAYSEEFDNVGLPAMTSLVYLCSHHALSSQSDSFCLHTFHRQFTRIIQGLCIIGHFHVPSDLLEPLPDALVSDVIDAVAHNHAHGSIAGAQQRPEILAGEIRGEWHPFRITVGVTVA